MARPGRRRFYGGFLQCTYGSPMNRCRVFAVVATGFQCRKLVKTGQRPPGIIPAIHNQAWDSAPPLPPRRPCSVPWPVEGGRAGAIEYGLIAALIAVAAVTVLGTVG